MGEIKYHDKINNRLVYIGNGSDSEYWDKHWEYDDLKNKIQQSSNPFIVNNTRKYLPLGSYILEGGCGRGENVNILKTNGYKITGLDYASNTVASINNVLPDLDVRLGDVRNIPFDNDTFDGYWSLGVIEHFYNGYDDIMEEMYRVLKKDGILFMTVPSMSLIRKLKAAVSKYPTWVPDDEKINNFYQFALDPVRVIKKFEDNGFRLIELKPYDGVKGLKDEVKFLNMPLQYIYDNNSIISKFLRKTIGYTMQGISSHMMLYVLKKI